MTPLPVLSRSQRVALLGGVSLVALQGISACTTTKVTPSPGYTPQVNVPYAPVPGTTFSDSGYVAPEYSQTGGMATTLAIGEEDGSYGQPVDQGFATTLAIGEEDGGGYGTVTDPGIATTLALGEEDGSYGQPVDQGFATTLAIGEEDGGGYGSVIDPGTATTLALGEEDGSLGPYTPPGLDVTTLAIGEEG